jgi:hypothetical protein
MLRRGSGGLFGFCLGLRLEQLGSQDENLCRCVYADTHLIAANFQNRDFDVVSDLDRFAGATREDEHGNPSMESCEAAMLA